MTGAPAPRPHRISCEMMSYISREILKSFLLVMAALEVVMGSIFCFGAVRDYGVDLALLLPLLGPALAAYLDAAIPVSLLFATALVYGRLTAEREFAAMKAFGFSYLELALPPLCLGLGSTAVVLILNFYVIPELRFTRDNLGGIILERLRSLGEGSSQSFDVGKELTIWVERFQGESLQGIFIAADTGESLGLKGLRAPEKGPVKALSYPLFLYAEGGGVVKDPRPGGGDMAIELRGVTLYYDDQFRSDVHTNFKQRLDLSRFLLPLKQPTERKNDKEVTEGELRTRIQKHRRSWETARLQEPQTAPAHRRAYYGAVTEYHRRISLALVSLAFPLAAAAVGLLLNSPNRLLPLFVSLLLAPPTFYVLEMGGNTWARAGHSPWLAEELGNLGLAVLIAGLFLVLRRRTLW